MYKQLTSSEVLNRGEHFLLSTYEESSLSGRKSCGSLYRHFDKAIRVDEKFFNMDVIDYICKNVDVDKLNVYQIIALLTDTLPARGKITSRERVYFQAKIALTNRLGVEKARRNLVGLEEK